MAEASRSLSASGFLEGLRGLTPRARLTALVTAAAAIALAVAALLYLRAPEWRILYTNVSDRDGGAIIAALGQMNVPYRFSEGGGAILVPAEHVHEARLRLASQGLPRAGGVGFELMENPRFGASQFQEQVSYQRALEGELARSIQSLAAVQSARVHLAIPKPSVFVREAAQPSASVLVNLHPGRALERAQVSGIVHLVSSSVPGLTPKNVTVVDQSGTLLSTPGNARSGAQLDAGQLAYVAQVEAAYIRRILDILEPMVGRANVRAQVTAELDFSETESSAETYAPNQDPKAAAVRSQQTLEAVNTGGGPGGVPGALSNQPAPPATAPIGQAGAATAAAPPAATTQTRREATTNFEVDKTVRHTRTPVGTLKRLSAAVVVNYRRVAEPAGGPDGKPGAGGAAAATKAVPLSAEEMAQINAVVKEALGFSQARGDSLNVVNVAFAEEPSDAPAELPLWRQPETLAFAKDAGRHALAGALLLYLLFGVLRPLVRRVAAAPAPGAAREGELIAAAPGNDAAPAIDRLQAARQLARQDPKVVAGVVRNWVSGGE